ncbi:hypothetical protein ACHQM5_011031 [Ranunculus cassubicifolius]
MKKAKILAERFLLNYTHPHYIQATLHSQFHQISFPNKPFSTHNLLNPHQKSHFSSKPNSIITLITTKTWSKSLEHELSNSNPSFTHETVIYVLKSLEKHPQKALNFLNWVTYTKGFTPSSIVYSLMLRILGNKEYIKEFWECVERLVDEDCDIDIGVYRAVLANFKNLEMMSDAKALTRLVSKMTKESGTTARVKNVVDLVLGSDLKDDLRKNLRVVGDSLSENIVLRIFWKLHKFPLKALLLFRWVEEHTDYTLKGAIYNGIVRVLAKEESVKEFWSMVEELKSSGYLIDIDTYIKVERQFLSSGMLKDAVQLYEQMMDGPYEPPLDNCNWLLREICVRVVKTYAAAGHLLSNTSYDWMYRCLNSVGNIEEAEKVLVCMKNEGFEPDSVTYGHAVFGYCRAGQLERATKVMDELESRGCISDPRTWAYLIQELCKAGELDQSIKYFMKMLQKNLEVEAEILDLLVNLLCNEGRVDNVYTLVIESVDKAKLTPLISTYKHVITNLLAEKKFGAAMILLRPVEEQNLRPIGALYVDYLSKSGSLDDATDFLKVVNTKQHAPSSFYFQILHSFCKEGRHSEAEELVDKYPYHIRTHANILKFFASQKLDNSVG